MVEERVTTRCAALGHPEIVLRLDRDVVIEPDVKWLEDYLERSVAAGVTYRAQETIQIGWSLDMFAQASPDRLLLEEPDFLAMPITFRAGVTATLTHLRLQGDVAKAFGAEPQFPSILESAIVCSRLSPERLAVAERLDPAPRDSGWFFGCGDASHDHNDPAQLTRVSLYAVGVEYRRLIPFMALPDGFRVDFEPGGATFERNGEAVLPATNSVLGGHGVPPDPGA